MCHSHLMDGHGSPEVVIKLVNKARFGEISSVCVWWWLITDHYRLSWRFYICGLGLSILYIRWADDFVKIMTQHTSVRSRHLHSPCVICNMLPIFVSALIWLYFIHSLLRHDHLIQRKCRNFLLGYRWGNFRRALCWVTRFIHL